MEQLNPRTALLPIVSYSARSCRDRDDALAVEEPLEISVGTTTRKATPVSVTMRTPGNDSELALGFLFTEGLLRDTGHVADHGRQNQDCDRDSANRYRIIFHEAYAPDLERLERYFYTSSSCGICGKASIEAIKTVSHRRIKTLTIWSATTLMRLPQTLRRQQNAFSVTGGLHAAGLVNPNGELTCVREDVGRHNAVDKLVGATLLDSSLDPTSSLLLLSGRASFELVQKAVMCGIPAIAAIGAPSTLAVNLAKENDIVLVGFLSDNRLNVYSGFDRVVGVGQNKLTEVGL